MPPRPLTAALHPQVDAAYGDSGPEPGRCRGAREGRSRSRSSERRSLSPRSALHGRRAEGQRGVPRQQHRLHQRLLRAQHRYGAGGRQRGAVSGAAAGLSRGRAVSGGGARPEPPSLAVLSPQTTRTAITPRSTTRSPTKISAAGRTRRRSRRGATPSRYLGGPALLPGHPALLCARPFPLFCAGSAPRSRCWLRGGRWDAGPHRGFPCEHRPVWRSLRLSRGSAPCRKAMMTCRPSCPPASSRTSPSAPRS